MGREITKQFETIVQQNAVDLLKFITNDPNQIKGEFVLIIVPRVKQKDDEHSKELSELQISTLKLLSVEFPPKKAVNITHQILGGDKDMLYQEIIKNKVISSSEKY